MDLKTIGGVLTKVGSGILQNAFPPLSNLAFAAINAALPEDKKLSDTATGEDAQAAIATLPPEQRASLMEKKLEVEITEIKEFTKVQASLAEVDKVGASTRPYIAKIMAQVVCFSIIIPISMLSIAILKSDAKTIKEVGDAWPMFVAILGTPTALLRAYFGMRTKEKEKRYEMAGAPQNAGWLGEIITAVKGK